MTGCVLSGSGLFTPEESISNLELVESLTPAVERFNREHAEQIAAEELEERDLPSERFIIRASGVKHRYVMDKRGVLDPDRLRPWLPQRGEEEQSIQCEMSLKAIHEALGQARRRPEEVDAVLVACSNLQRPYPAIAIEIQDALGAGGWGYDLNVACSSATFGIQAAVDAVRCGNARCAVVVSPEITSGHNNFELRDYHFIFGDACTAVVVEACDSHRAEEGFEILGTRLQTRFSNNVRNDFGFLNRCEEGERPAHDLVFRQRGRKVLQEVCPMVSDHIRDHLAEHQLAPGDVQRMWLHQANLGMNQLIARTLLDRDPEPGEAPVILDEYANTSSAGSVIAFHKYKHDLEPGAIGVLCSFGAGYSVGSVILRKLRA